MNGSIRSKLVLSLLILLMMAVSIAIPFSGSIAHSFAALTNPGVIASGIVPSPTASPPHPTQTPEPVRWSIQEGIPYTTLNGTTYKLNIYTCAATNRCCATCTLLPRLLQSKYQ